MMWCKRCSYGIGMLELGCLSCDHKTDWVEVHKPKKVTMWPLWLLVAIALLVVIVTL